MPEDKKIGVGVGVLILREGKVLLGKRFGNFDEKNPLKGAGTWTMPGGKLEFGETFEEAAIRETKEETGIDLKKVRVICCNNDRSSASHFVTIGLCADEFEGEAKICEPDKITEWGWFSLEGLPVPLYFPSKEILENYQTKKFYIEK